MKTLVLAACGVMLVGCSATNISDLERAHAEFMRALGDNPATVCVSASYGPAQIVGARTNIVNGDVKCSSSGLEVKSQASQVGVPMTIVPQLQMGQPTMIQAPPVK